MVRQKQSSKKRHVDFEKAELVALIAGELAASNTIAKREIDSFTSKEGTSVIIRAGMIIITRKGKSVWLDKETLQVIHSREKST